MPDTVDDKIDNAVYVAMNALGLSFDSNLDTAELLNDCIRELVENLITDDDEFDKDDRHFFVIVHGDTGQKWSDGSFGTPIGWAIPGSGDYDLYTPEEAEQKVLPAGAQWYSPYGFPLPTTVQDKTNED